jgi:GNAT superfamily N-acetyltransferase
MNGLAEDPIAFELYNNDDFIGCLVIQMFWGQMHIKFLYARKLLEHAFLYAQSRGSKFAFVETFNFQAPEFYKKLGFEVELVRQGYDRDTSFYYLRKYF